MKQVPGAAPSAPPSALISLELWLAASESIAFSWERLAQHMKAAYDARVAAPSRSGRKLALRVQVPEASLPRLLGDAERGELDTRVRATGARFVQEISQEERCLYNHVPEVGPAKLQPYEDVSTSKLKELLARHKVEVLLLTSTDTERNALHAEMTPLPGHKGLVEGAIKHVTYRLGQFGRYAVAHAESTMGSQARHGAALTIHDAISELSPKAVVVVGIAFGLDPVRQRLGDVIVAETVIPYELQRMDKTVTHRGQPIACGPLLSERFRTRRADWRLTRGEDSVKVFQGALLSGEKLVDNLAFREELLRGFPHALAGEMEGAGVYAATDREGVQVLLIKGLCDWGDGSKTNRAQSFAARAAVLLAEHVLSKKEVLAPLVIHEVGPALSEVGTLLAPASQFLSSEELAPQPRTPAALPPAEPPAANPVAPQPAPQPPAAAQHGESQPRQRRPLSRTRLVVAYLLFCGVVYVIVDGKAPAVLLAINQALCSVDIASSCVDVGVAYEKGEGVLQNWNQAAQYYQRSCAGRNAAGCFNLGRFYMQGIGVPRDSARGIEAYGVACDGGLVEGCNALRSLGVRVPRKSW